MVANITRYEMHYFCIGRRITLCTSWTCIAFVDGESCVSLQHNAASWLRYEMLSISDFK